MSYSGWSDEDLAQRNAEFGKRLNHVEADVRRCGASKGLVVLTPWTSSIAPAVQRVGSYHLHWGPAPGGWVCECISLAGDRDDAPRARRFSPAGRWRRKEASDGRCSCMAGPGTNPACSVHV